jgi:protein O-GlcNAc transferase
MWMGVPVVTRVGETVVGRAGWSLMHNLDLTELVARTDDQFVQIAVELAGDLNRLGNLRATLRARMEQSPLMDSARFARNMEAAYRRMWQAWCRNRG